MVDYVFSLLMISDSFFRQVIDVRIYVIDIWYCIQYFDILDIITYLNYNKHVHMYLN